MSMMKQMIMQRSILQAKRKVSDGSMALVFLLALLVCSLVFPSSSNSQSTTSQEVITGQETSPNYIPGMEEHTTSGGTLHNSGTGTSQGCKSGNFCTAGTQGPGGTYSSTFDLKDNMTIDQINRGFKMDYGLDVDSHVSNSVLASCVGGNTLQNSDCRDIFKLTVTLFGTNGLRNESGVAHKFEHEVELDYSGVRSFAFSQDIPSNTFTSLTGEFDMFGIDAGFPQRFFGPAFSAPFLTTTFDLVTLIETEVIDIINNTDILEQNTPEEMEVVEIQVEVESPDGQQMASLELEVNAEMEMELEMPTTELSSPTEPEIEVAEVNTEIEAEMQNESTTDQPVESTESQSEGDGNTETESNQEPERTTEAEPREQEGEPETSDAESSSEPAAPKPKAKVKVAKKTSAKQKAANKIVKKMGDKGRYDSTNQLKTLVIMNVLGDTKKFLVQPTIPQPTGLFTDAKIPDAQLPENNAAAWMLMGGSSQLHKRLTDSQYER